MKTEYVATCAYHPEYTGPEGRDFHLEDGETWQSLAARGYVDHPAKAGFLDVWGQHGRPQCEQILSDYKNGKLPAFDELVKKDIETEMKKLERIQQELAAAQAEKQSILDGMREPETFAQTDARRKEKEMDDYQDSGAFSKDFISGMKTKHRETEGKKAKTVSVKQEVSKEAAEVISQI